jgi:uncharacterized protein (TIGR02145 family)
MKKIFLAFVFAASFVSCKKETSTSNNDGGTNTIDTTKTTTTSSGINFTSIGIAVGSFQNNITDVDGNTYKTVKIGNQVWMAENLKTAKYSDGTIIPNVKDSAEWSNLITGAWAYYKNDTVYNSKYGKLYNWYSVSPTTNGDKNVCPTGWHVPTDNEWTLLTDFLGGKNIAGGKMKEIGTTNWNSPNKDATNTSLFTGLPGGFRSGGYGNISSCGFWWSSSKESISYYAWGRYLYINGGIASSGNFEERNGMSIRCLRD